MGKVKYSIDTILINPPLVKHYTSLDKELIDFISEFNAKPNPILRIKKLFGEKVFKPKVNELWELKWIELIELKFDLEDQDLKAAIQKLYTISDKELLQVEVLNFKSCIAWITNQLEDIAETESENLSYTPSNDELDAGVDELQKYDYYVTLDSLTEGDSTKEDYYLNKPYSYIFRKLCLINDKRLINEKMQEIVSRKARTN